MSIINATYITCGALLVIGLALAVFDFKKVKEEDALKRQTPQIQREYLKMQQAAKDAAR